jgi:hypothetical protein
MIYGVGGQIHFPWFSFWRSNPLAGERLALFVSIVEDVLLQDPDLEESSFVILDFSAPQAKYPRELKAIDAREIARVSEVRKVEMLEVFADGFLLAQAELTRMAEAAPETQPRDGDGKGDQQGLFDSDR